MYLPPYFFLPEHIIFFKKIMCCGKFVTTHYFLSHYTLFFFKKYCVADNTIFFEKNVLWLKKNNVLRQTYHNTWHSSFQKKYCVVASLSQHIIFWVTTHYFFQKNIVLRTWRTRHNTIFFDCKLLTACYLLRPYSLQFRSAFQTRTVIPAHINQNFHLRWRTLSSQA